MTAGDHLFSLRLLNRLLSLDENNAEVLALVQGLHTQSEVPAQQRARAPLWALGAAALVGLVLLGAGGLALTWTMADPAGRPVAVPGGSADPRKPPAPVPAPEAFVAVQPAPELPPEPVPVMVVSPGPELPIPAPAPQPAAPAPKRPTLFNRLPDRGDASDISVRQAPPTDAPAELLVTANFPADIYLGNDKIGATRPPSPISIPAGSHRLTIRSERTIDYVLAVELSPGETKKTPVMLDVRPAALKFARDFDPTCEVRLDQRRQGSLGELGFQLMVDRPNVAHELSVSCRDAAPVVRDFKFIEPGTFFAAATP